MQPSEACAQAKEALHATLGGWRASPQAPPVTLRALRASGKSLAGEAPRLAIARQKALQPRHGALHARQKALRMHPGALRARRKASSRATQRSDHKAPSLAPKEKCLTTAAPRLVPKPDSLAHKAPSLAIGATSLAVQGPRALRLEYRTSRPKPPPAARQAAGRPLSSWASPWSWCSS